jgi:tetratricopeptide (TPR) repeat protein
MSQGLCPSCGAAVNLTAGQTETKCQYCDTVVTLQQAETHFAKVKSGKGGGAVLLGNISLTNGDYGKALTYFDKAIEQDETFAEAWLARGECYAKEFKYNLLKTSGQVPEKNDAIRLNTGQAISSLEAAIQFAANSQAMRKRAVKVIAEAVTKIMEREDSLFPDVHKYNIYYDSDVNKLLAWGIKYDPKSELLLCAGSSFYKRFEIWEQERAKKFDVKIREKFDTELKTNASLYFAALQELNHQALKSSEETALKYREVAQKHFQKSADLLNAMKGLHEQTSAMLSAHTEKTKQESATANRNGCFVATACYGDYAHPTVLELRRFRDVCLETSPVSRAFVRWYYKWSPPIANVIGKNTILKTIARVLIIAPALAVTRINGIISQQK